MTRTVEVPSGWMRVTLGQVTLPRRETIDPREAAGDTYIGLEHVQKDTGRLLGIGEAHRVRSAKALFKTGDVLYARLRPNLNKVWRADRPGICSTEFIVFGLLPEIDPDFLAIRLRCDDFVTFASERVGGMQYPRISTDTVARFELLLPPFEEQRRIAGLVNRTAGEIEESIHMAVEAGTCIARLEKSILKDALSGVLTKSWRVAEGFEDDGADGSEPQDGGPLGMVSLPRSWRWTTWGESGSSQNGRAFPSQQYRDNGIRLLRAGNLAPDGTLDWTDANTRHLDSSWAESHPDFVVNGGELVMNLTAQSLADDFLGRVCLTKPDERCLLNQRIARLSSTQASSKFLHLVFRSRDFRRFVERSTTGSLIQHLSTQALNSFAIALPPLDEQAAIVAVLQSAETGLRTAAEHVAETIATASRLRRAIANNAVRGELGTRNPEDGDAGKLLSYLQKSMAQEKLQRQLRKAEAKGRKREMAISGNIVRRGLADQLVTLGSDATAAALFEAAGFQPEDVFNFYDELHRDKAVLAHFRRASDASREDMSAAPAVSTLPETIRPGRFRIVNLWVERFKNLVDFEVSLDPGHAFDVILGWNGTGKSNFLEALVIVFRDLLHAKENDRLITTAFSYRLTYEIDGRTIHVDWRGGTKSRRLTATVTPAKGVRVTLKRTDIPLPRFLFGYYSGPTNRLREHFLQSEREHYYRLVDSKSDNPQTMLNLLEGRRLFCADARHAKYVVMGFFHKEDPDISRFLSERLRVDGFESALFIFHKPAWARPGEDESNFWGASGVVRHFLERLRRIAVAPMKVTQTMSDGYRQSREDHLYFLIPDVERLRLLAAEYPDARSFFLALESADFSEMIQDVKVKVRVRGEGPGQVPIVFREMSEGEQQLLTVLGLLRFTKAHQSLILLDEPDTHLNPHWAMDYLDLLGRVMSGDDDADERGSSQILMTTHDPLVVMGLVKEQIHMFKREAPTGRCSAQQARENPKGLGFTGVLTSDMFGFASDLDPASLDLLHTQARLAGKSDPLTEDEERKLEEVSIEIDRLGFQLAGSDPYYRAFLQGVQRRSIAAKLLSKTFMEADDMDALAAETDAILAEIAAAEKAGR